jgi:hypothetical protein
MGRDELVRDDMRRRWRGEEGIDPEGSSRMFEANQFANVRLTLWKELAPNGKATSFTMKLEHIRCVETKDSSYYVERDGESFEGDDAVFASVLVAWGMQQLHALFPVSEQ